MKKLWLLFGVFMLLFIAVTGGGLRMSNSDATQTMWQIIKWGSAVLAVAMLIKYRLPPKKQVVISLVFGLLLFAPYVSVAGVTAFLAVDVPLVTFLSFMAFFQLSNRYPENTIILIRNESGKSFMSSVVLGLAVGAFLGIINVVLNSYSGGAETNIRLDPQHFIVPLNPGIYEEVVFRAFFFMVSLHFLKGSLATRGRRFTAWFMMVLPHVLVHTPNAFIENGIGGWLIYTVMLAGVFGLPFAFLQLKRDLASAMIAHITVMVIFFNVFGIPA